ncbi:MAG: hypothetical protein R2681_17625 [Pyrinomonadaceae bacterium]
MKSSGLLGKKGLYLLWAVLFVYSGFLFNFGPYTQLKALVDGKELPEEKFGVKPEEFYEFLEKIGASGVSTYSTFQLLDYLNGILLAAALFSTLYLFLGRLGAGQTVRSVLVFPVCMGTLDVIENSGVLYLLRQYPEKLESFASNVAFITNAKLVFGMFGFLSLIFCAVVLIFRAIFGTKAED